MLDALQNVAGSADALTQSFMAQQTQNIQDTINSATAGLSDEIAALRREIQQQSRATAA